MKADREGSGPQDRLARTFGERAYWKIWDADCPANECDGQHGRYCLLYYQGRGAGRLKVEQANDYLGTAHHYLTDAWIEEVAPLIVQLKLSEGR